jgi:hypothetical protein
MTFTEWNDQLLIPFDDWFIKEWDEGWLRADDRVTKYIVRYLQEVSVQVKHDVTKEMFVSVFKIKDRYFRIRWFYTHENQLCVGTIEEVRQLKKNIEVEYYIPI